MEDAYLLMVGITLVGLVATIAYHTQQERPLVIGCEAGGTAILSSEKVEEPVCLEWAVPQTVDYATTTLDDINLSYIIRLSYDSLDWEEVPGVRVDGTTLNVVANVKENATCVKWSS